MSLTDPFTALLEHGANRPTRVADPDQNAIFQPWADTLTLPAASGPVVRTLLRPDDDIDAHVTPPSTCFAGHVTSAAEDTGNKFRVTTTWSPARVFGRPAAQGNER